VKSASQSAREPHAGLRNLHGGGGALPLWVVSWKNEWPIGSSATRQTRVALPAREAEAFARPRGRRAGRRHDQDGAVNGRDRKWTIEKRP
jgi:hypothetical protein